MSRHKSLMRYEILFEIPYFKANSLCKTDLEYSNGLFNRNNIVPSLQKSLILQQALLFKLCSELRSSFHFNSQDHEKVTFFSSFLAEIWINKKKAKSRLLANSYLLVVAPKASDFYDFLFYESLLIIWIKCTKSVAKTKIFLAVLWGSLTPMSLLSVILSIEKS